MTAGVEALSMIILFLWVEIVSWIHHGLNERLPPLDLGSALSSFSLALVVRTKLLARVVEWLLVTTRSG